MGELLDIPESQAVPKRMLAGRRVLIVEDEVILAFNLECEVQDAGGEVVGPAYSVGEARQLISGGIAAAILDININGEQIWTDRKSVV